ncbi:Imm7 family immunity protein [Kitasatospora sp. NPDC091257]|uniref:Imm7 family immunity protein n=1 Tax=Kitasatospora sp. NPDC091257 TaxID=3364084 RepID=UPI00380F21FC
MFGYRGWIEVAHSADADADADEERLREVTGGLARRIREISGPHLLDPGWMNGEPFVHLAGFTDHGDERIPSFFREAGTRAPGSYGLPHVRDDEDPGHENGMRLTGTVRGRATEGPSPLLPPRVPVLEDPFHVRARPRTAARHRWAVARYGVPAPPARATSGNARPRTGGGGPDAHAGPAPTRTRPAVTGPRPAAVDG